MEFQRWYLEIYEGKLDEDWLQKAFNEGVIEGGKLISPTKEDVKKMEEDGLLDLYRKVVEELQDRGYLAK